VNKNLSDAQFIHWLRESHKPVLNREVGIPDFTELLASLLLAAGVPPNVVQQRLGQQNGSRSPSTSTRTSCRDSNAVRRGASVRCSTGRSGRPAFGQQTVNNSSSESKKGPDNRAFLCRGAEGGTRRFSSLRLSK
jgi:hypothetical protein